MIPFDLDLIKKQIADSEAKMNKEGFWDNQKEALGIVSFLNSKKDLLNQYETISKGYAGLIEIMESGDESPELLELAEIEYETLRKNVTDLRTQVLFAGEFDGLNAVVDIHPGAGGTESQDWASMLYRMYVRWAEQRKFKMQIVDYQDGDEAGLKSATIIIRGPNAYGLLKSEKGVHRLVRISPFDAAGRRHTSFASVNVIPEFTDEIEIEINESDLRIDTFRSGGAGGQNVNKVSSAVRITHFPSGIVTSSQVERSQLQNKAIAMQMLKGQLYQRKLQEKQNTVDKIVGEQKNIEWGSQIRSYVFCPYTMVKDHRTDYQEGDVSRIMDGGIDGFLYSYLEKEAKEHEKK